MEFGKMKKKKQYKHSDFLAYNKLGHPPAYTKFEDSEAEKSLTECFIGEKDKWTNKRNDKQRKADILGDNTISHTLSVYKLSKA